MLLRLRRVLGDGGESARPRLVETIDNELAITDSVERKADLHAEKARAQAAGGRLVEANASYENALRLVPRHAASLQGLEITLRQAPSAHADPALVAQLTLHLDRMATAYLSGPDCTDGDVHLAAWLQVERATLLDRVLERPAEARAALEQAVTLEPEPGPVRAAFNRHLIRHRDAPALGASLGAEAALEEDDDRASRLRYLSARILIEHQGGPHAASVRGGTEASEILWLLRSAAKRAVDNAAIAHRALDELVYLLEQAGEVEQAVATREERLLALSKDASTPADAIVHEHVRLSMLETSLGHLDRAASHAERALSLDPENDGLRNRLDGLLVRLNRQEDRIRLWVAEETLRGKRPSGFGRCFVPQRSPMRRWGERRKHSRTCAPHG